MPTFLQRHVRLLFTLFAAALFALAATVPARAETVAPPDAADLPTPVLSQTFPRPTTGGKTPLTEIPAGAEQVTVGLYAVNAYDIDFKANTYALSAYVWLKWRGDFDPTASLEFQNAIEEWALMITNVYDEPVDLGDGEMYQVMRVNGLFFQAFEMKDYPLDQQELTLVIEDTDATAEERVYLVDTEATSLAPELMVPGWRIDAMEAESSVHDYVSHMGDTTAGEGASKYAAITFSIGMERSASFFIWKLLFPLVIVLLTCWLALLLKPRWVDLRTGMPATALLTVVFLQISYADALPQNSELVLMDKIYVLVYILVVGTLIQIVWGNRQLREDADEASHARIWRVNVISAIVQAAIFAVGLGAIIALR